MSSSPRRARIGKACGTRNLGDPEGRHPGPLRPDAAPAGLKDLPRGAYPRLDRLGLRDATRFAGSSGEAGPNFGEAWFANRSYYSIFSTLGSPTANNIAPFREAH
jgi:hypothetical protein